MPANAPHFLLFADVDRDNLDGQWCFMLTSADGQQELVAADVEPGVGGERLELLSVVRGLEALNQPSKVTLLTGSRYIRQGLTMGIPEWRENGWRWERFGEWVPVKNADLWQRVDRALGFHDVQCHAWRFDPAHGSSTHSGAGRHKPTSPRMRKFRQSATSRRGTSADEETCCHKAVAAKKHDERNPAAKHSGSKGKQRLQFAGQLSAAAHAWLAQAIQRTRALAAG